jgi:hypothetical protein
MSSARKRDVDAAPSPTERDAAPNWVRDAVSVTGHEIAGYVTVLWGLLARPERFVREWATGTRPFMNPLGVMATGITIYTIIGMLSGFNTSVRSDQPFWLIALNAIAPYLHLVLIGALCHGMLRLAGSPLRLRDSLGIALYAGGCVGVVYRLATWATAAYLVRKFGIANIMLAQMPRSGVIVGAVIYAGGLFAYSAVIVRALAALHRRQVWLILPIMLVAMYLAAILYGIVRITGVVDLGPHLWLQLDQPQWIRRLIPNLAV